MSAHDNREVTLATEPRARKRHTAIYWLHGTVPVLTCGKGDCTSAERQCDKCRADEGQLRRDERRTMCANMLAAMGLRISHDRVVTDD